MMIKKPHLHGSPTEQLAQLRSWLFELVDVLNYILQQIEEDRTHAQKK
ncbi:MAG: hypothetical protein IIX86_09030 [Clostridia bacterium]|nr:hypothetical protein [Clostridia bacterium]